MPRSPAATRIWERQEGPCLGACTDRQLGFSPCVSLVWATEFVVISYSTPGTLTYPPSRSDAAQRPRSEDCHPGQPAREPVLGTTPFGRHHTRRREDWVKPWACTCRRVNAPRTATISMSRRRRGKCSWPSWQEKEQDLKGNMGYGLGQGSFCTENSVWSGFLPFSCPLFLLHEYALPFDLM